MSCINPFNVTIYPKFSPIRNITVGCGYCLNCLETRVSQIDFLAHRELYTRYQKGESAAYCTFTYNDDCIPRTDSGHVTLRRDDVKLFLKRIRRNIDHEFRKCPHLAPKFKTMYCGEYGDGGRPHYHIIFFGLSDSQVEHYAKKSWRKGLYDIQPTGNGCIRYVCKYLMKCHPGKDIKKFYEENGIEKPFFYHSVGFAKDWIESNIQKIVDDGFTFWTNGKIRLFPKYVLRYVSIKSGVPYQPYVTRFLSNSSLNQDARNKGISYSQADFEQSYVKYKSAITRLRQSGQAVDDVTILGTFRNPHTKSNIKQYIEAIDSARVSRDFNTYGDVVPF